MSGLSGIEGDVVELDGRGLCAVPGLVDCHTHPAFGGDRVEEFTLRAPAAPLRGAARRRRRHPRDGDARREPPVRRGSRRQSRGTATGCCAPGRRRSRGSRATGSTARPSSRRCGRSSRRAGSPPGSERTRCRRSTRTRTRTSTSSWPTCSPKLAPLAEAADVFLERGAFDVAAGSTLPRGVSRARARAAPPRRPVHGGRCDPARDRARRPLGRPSRGHWPERDRPARRERRHRCAPACERARPRPPDAAGAGARRCRRRGRSRDRLQSGQRVLREPAVRRSRSRRPS